MRYMMFVCVDPAAETYAPEEDNIDEWIGGRSASSATA
jgi:hypothetical protein